jgi:hypothetical protein
VAIVRNLTLIKCTPGHRMPAPMPAVWGTSVSAAVLGNHQTTVERKRFGTELTAVRVQTIDYPSTASAPPHERRP